MANVTVPAELRGILLHEASSNGVTLSNLLFNYSRPRPLCPHVHAGINVQERVEALKVMVAEERDPNWLKG